MTDKHPITPPPELVEKWASMLEYCEEIDVFTDAVRWGADQELEACRLWVSVHESISSASVLVYARRPKPPSLKEQALEAFYQIESEFSTGRFGDTIRRALEQLDD